MEYSLVEIEYVKAVKIIGFKADVQVQVSIKLKQAIDIQNIQVKLVSNRRGFNQIDKRWIDSYDRMWNFSEKVKEILKLYTGEIKHNYNSKSSKRLFANEFCKEE